MTDFGSWEDLLQYVNGIIAQGLEEAVWPTVRIKIQENVEKYVYDAYTPKRYHRTFLLEDDIQHDLPDSNTLVVWDDATQDGTARTNVYIPEIIEYGEWQSQVGYEWVPRGANTGIYTYLLPRPFIAHTVADLTSSLEHVYALKNYMKDFVDFE
jgi:hypothetical protein